MFLASLQDEIDRSHRREAFWMSVLVHLVALVVFVDGAKLLTKQQVVMPAQTEVLQEHSYTFLVLPPDLQKNAAKPHTSILSDEDRVASSSQPVLDRKVLEHILASSRKGLVSAKTHQLQAKALPAAVSANAMAQSATETAAASPVPIRPGEPKLASVLAASPAQAPAAASKPGPVAVVGTPAGASAGGTGTRVSEVTGAGSQPASRSNVDVLSDTMGVNFGPYLSQILRAVRANWYSRIPESARAPLMKKGQVSIQFDILKTGQIAAMQVVGTSGDASLDGAAIVGIDQSGPFPPLPPQFQGQYLALRFHFFYNPDTNDPR
jgi:TonB family protein